MSEITEEQKEVIRELRYQLNGKCKSSVCPGDLTRWRWSCDDCEKHFGWLTEKEKLTFCPCNSIAYETIDLRFSELLEEEI